MTFGNSSKVIHTGDTIHVTFPEATDTAAGIQGIPHQIPVKYNNPSDPGDPLNGQTIATVDITITGVTITFNSKMNDHILTSGSLSFTGQVVTKKERIRLRSILGRIWGMFRPHQSMLVRRSLLFTHQMLVKGELLIL